MEELSANGVLRQIAPCDIERPYIFISYSSADSDLVWRDVLEFQKRGFNIWLDEKIWTKPKAPGKTTRWKRCRTLTAVWWCFM